MAARDWRPKPYCLGQKFNRLTHTRIAHVIHVVEKAREITGLKTQREIIDHALKEIVRRHEISKLMELRGIIEWDGDLEEMRAGRELCES